MELIFPLSFPAGGLGEVLDLSLLASDEQNSEPNTKVSVLTTVEGKQQVGIFQIAHSVIKNGLLIKRC